MSDVRVPHLGESITAGVIARWHKQNGEAVRSGDPLFELETDKAAMEIAAEAAGTLEIVAPEGATVEVGAVVARIAEAGAAERSPAEPKRERRPEAPPERREPAAERRAEAMPERREAAPERREAAPERRVERVPDRREAAPERRVEPVPDRREAAPERREPAARPVGDSGPAVRKLVAEHGVDPASVPGTGKDGRLTKGDVLRTAERRAEAPAKTERTSETKHADGTRRVPMSGIRRVIADRLVQAQRTAAILTTFNEIDMSEVTALRRRHRERFKARHGVDLGYTSLFARAAVGALQAVPIVNARIDGTDVVYSDVIHLGIAVSTPRGLVVPVVRHAEAMSVAALERAIADLAGRAREARIAPDDLMGGTFTITNGGVFGSLFSTPILNPPQAGILGLHKIEDRPVAREGQVVIRPMMYVALSYDHRLVDGEQAVTFLVRVKEQLEDPARMVLDI